MSLTALLPRRENGLRRNILESAIIATFLTALSMYVGLRAGWIEEVNYLEAFAVVTSYACTYLCVMERRFNYVLGVITTISYCILFYQWGLYASMATNAYLVFAVIYGWFRWNRDDNTRPVRRVELKWVPAYVITTALAYGGVVLITSAMGATLPLMDSVILVGTILAQFLLDNKRIETWAVWAIVNIVAIYVYFTAGLALAAFQYVFFLANSAYGWYMWRRSMESEVEPETVPANLVPATV